MRWHSNHNLLCFLALVALQIATYSPGLARAADITLGASADNTIDHDVICTGPVCGQPGSGSHSSATMTVSILPDCQREGRALIRFNLSAMPQDLVVSTAKLRLFATCQSEYDQNTFWVRRLTEDWVSNETDWCLRKAGTSWGTPGGTQTTQHEVSLVVPDKHPSEPDPISICVDYSEWLEWDVTSIVRQWVNDDSLNWGFCVSQAPLSTGNQAILFATREHPSSLIRPQLVISTPNGACCVPHPGPTDDACLQLNAYECGVAGYFFLGPGFPCDIPSCEAVTGVPENPRGEVAPLRLTLYPNPTFGKITYTLYLAEEAHVTLSVFDVAGRAIGTLIDDRLSAGDHVLRVDARQDLQEDLPSGIYYVQARTASFQQTRKLVLN